MKIRVGDAFYSASPCFMTLLRYRTLFDTSYLSDAGTDERTLIRLVYAAIDPKKRLEYEEFEREAAQDALFPLAALKLRQCLLRGDGEGKRAAASAVTPPEKEYEYALLGIFAAQGFDRGLLDEMTMAQAVHMVGVALRMRNPDARPREMSAAERKKAYGITPEKEKDIATYLKAQK